MGILKLGILRDKREDDPFHLDAPVKLARENYVTTRQRREVTNFNRFQIHDWAKNMYKCRGWQKMRLLLMIFFFNPPVQSSAVRLAHNTNFGDEVRHNDNFLHKFENCQEKNKYSISIQRDPVKCEKALNGLLNKKTFNSRQKGIEKFAERVETQQTDRIRFFAPKKRLPIFVEIGAKKSSSLSL